MIRAIQIISADVWAATASQPATREPSLASRLGPSGECQAQGVIHLTTVIAILSVPFVAWMVIASLRALA